MPLSGPDWVAQYPTSASTDDLVDPFQTSVVNFLSALDAGGATVEISATYRPPERAYLMHYCCQVGGLGGVGPIDAATVPAFDCVDIQWAHTDDAGATDTAASQVAAKQMATHYGIAFPAALVSRHTQRLAIDMTISWSGILTIVDGTGTAQTVTSLPRSGANADLQAVGKSYGVIKLATDPPHWSSDGH